MQSPAIATLGMLLAVSTLLSAMLASPASAQNPGARRLRFKQSIQTRDLGIRRPAAIAYAAAGDRFLVGGLAGDGALSGPFALARMARLGGDAGTVVLPVVPADPRAFAWDARGRRLLVFDERAQLLHAIPASVSGDLEPGRASRLAVPIVGTLRATGMAVDPGTGDVWFLDRATRRILRWRPGGGAPAWIALDLRSAATLAGLAFDPATRRLFVIETEAGRIHELSAEGRRLATHDGSALGLARPQALAFAPSSDQTDDAGTLSLFVADAGRETGDRGHIVELAWEEPAGAAIAVSGITATLARVVPTSQWSPPSPDPSGIAYDAATGRLVIVDGEVDEMTIFAGKNVFETSLLGVLQRSFGVQSFSAEPVGVAHVAASRRLFVSDDDKKRVFEIAPGPDGVAGTGDDAVTSFSTSAFGSNDPEGLSHDPAGGRLFIADGVNQEVYVVRAGANGRFDGVAPAGDDQVTQFDTAVLGVLDPETVEWNAATGTLLLLGRANKKVVEVTTDGQPIAETDLSFAPLANPAGLAVAPSSANPTGKSWYVVNRAVDNDSNPLENDGTLVEIALDAPPAPGVVDARVAASADDAEESASGGVSLTSTDLELVFDGSNQTIGMRFAGLAIPRGARIRAAHVQLEADEVQSEATSLEIRGHAADDAPAFASAAGNLSTRPRTTARALWAPAAWNATSEAGPAQRTPDLAAILQEIVDRPGWASGRAIALLVTGTGHRTARAFDGKPAGAPLLHVELETIAPPPPPPPPPPGNLAPVVSAGPDLTVTLPASAALDGTVSDDGLPAPPAAVTTAWSVASGPGPVRFADANAVDTQASFDSVGTYALRLTASDGALSTSDTTRITVRPLTNTILERRIGAGTDDAEESATGTMSLASPDLQLVRDASDQVVGLRFRNLSIPRGATIVKAYVQLKSVDAQNEATSLTLRGQAADQSATFTTANGNLSSRPRTAAAVAWSPPPWAGGEAGAAQRTPDLAAVIQEIVARPGWSSGNAIVILIGGTGRRTAGAYEARGNTAALLHVEYR